MGDTYCVYKNQKYQAEIKNNKIEITSNCHDEGFVEYVDVVGRIHNDLFIKKLDIDETDFIYQEDIFLKYKGAYFQLFADKITANAVVNDSYMIWTDSEHVARDYIFEKKEQFVYIKYIKGKEIEAIKVVKKPLLKFESEESLEEIIVGEELNNLLAGIS